MNTRQFNKAVALAKTPEAVTWARYEEGKEAAIIDLEMFDGCALHNAPPVVCTIADVAKLVKYNCQLYNGGWDEKEMLELRDLAKRQFRIYGDPIQDAADQRKLHRLEAEALARADLARSPVPEPARLPDGPTQPNLSLPVRRIQRLGESL